MHAIPDPRICEQARLSRDPRFDGLFFTAVTSTGIYCRPVCPAPRPKPRNVTYYPTAASAEAAGFRPCLRCRPELAPGDAWRHGDDVVARALALIDEGALADAPLSRLAARLALGERQLRRLFVERLGAPPIGVHGTRRLLLAKQLLTDTAMPIADVALAAGFGSFRRFNTVFRAAYRMAPRDLRRVEGVAPGGALVLRLGYRPPYDFAAHLDFLRARALPGLEIVDESSYARAVGPADAPGWIRVSRWGQTRVRHGSDTGQTGARLGSDWGQTRVRVESDPNPPNPAHALRLELHGTRPASLLAIVNQVRRLFDVDADPDAIAAALAGDPRLRRLIARRPGLRLPGGWDGFEIAVRAVVGQQVSVTAARTIAARIATRFGPPLPDDLAALGFARLFPAAAALADADLGAVGLTRDRAHTIRQIARAILAGRVDFSRERTLEDFVARWTALPGIGPWTAHYIAMRALGHPDAFPAEDLVLQKALPKDGTRLTARALRAHAEAWRPWRAYAVVHLWRDAAGAPTARRATISKGNGRTAGPVTTAPAGARI